MEKIHFPGLNGLRFIAALSVILSHVEFIKREYGITNNIAIMPDGHLGVALFFVLSGFLITFLLLTEKDKFKKVSIKKFYIRRILRIWPLYFFLLLICFFLFPVISKDPLSFNFFHSGDYTLSLLLYVFFLPNLAFQLVIGVPLGYHLWSIGVEEQFYLVWPVLVNYFRKYIFAILIIIFLGVSLLPNAMDFINNNIQLPGSFHNVLSGISKFFMISKFNCMALGGITALMYIKKYNFLKYIRNKYVEVIIFCSTFIMWIFRVKFNYFTDEFYSLLFAVIILNAATSPDPVIKLEKKWLDYLGKISYGLYMYHWLSIVILIYGLRFFLPEFESPQHIVYYNLIIYPLAVGLTIAISSLSYELFEKRFLILKARFSKIISG